MSPRPPAIEALAARPAMAALVLDFDGVLAPIVDEPDAAAMPPPVAQSVARLAAALGLLAVISGRPAEFLADRVRAPGARLLGSYGIEQIRDGTWELAPAARAWLGAVDDARSSLTYLAGRWPGVRIEVKPASVAVHWRQAIDREAAAAAVREAGAKVAAQTGLRAEPGKLVEELRPPIDVDKGSAVAALIAAEQPGAVAYAGDDLGDIPALRAVRQAGGYALVVDHGTETDQRLLDLADEVFAGTDGFADWLAELAGRVAA